MKKVYRLVYSRGTSLREEGLFSTSLAAKQRARMLNELEINAEQAEYIRRGVRLVSEPLDWRLSGGRTLLADGLAAKSWFKITAYRVFDDARDVGRELLNEGETNL